MEKYLEYITSGLNLKWKKSQLLSQKIAPIIIGLLGLFPGIILGSYWLIIGVFMVTISAISSLICLFILKNKMILRTYLVFQIILCADWMLQFILCQIVYFTMVFGLNGYILIIFFPLFIPVCLGLINASKLKKGCYKKNITHGVVAGGSFGGVGLIGMIFAEQFFKDASQEFAVLIVVFCFSLVTVIFSIGLLSIQKLYYLLKIEKTQNADVQVYIDLT